MTDQYTAILGELARSGVRFLVIGAFGINYYAMRKQVLINTDDCDLFLPPDPKNLVSCWQTLESHRLELTSHGELLEKPLDLWLAERVVERRAVVRALGPSDLKIDLTLMMKGFHFENLWAERRTFTVEGQEIPVAPLSRIVESKKAAGRDKDVLFFVSHEEILKELLGDEGDQAGTASET